MIIVFLTLFHTYNQFRSIIFSVYIDANSIITIAINTFCYNCLNCMFDTTDG